MLILACPASRLLLGFSTPLPTEAAVANVYSGVYQLQPQDECAAAGYDGANFFCWQCRCAVAAVQAVAPDAQVCEWCKSMLSACVKAIQLHDTPVTRLHVHSSKSCQLIHYLSPIASFNLHFAFFSICNMPSNGSRECCYSRLTFTLLAIKPAAVQVIIYSGDGLTAKQLLQSAASNFDITVTNKFKVKPPCSCHKPTD